MRERRLVLAPGSLGLGDKSSDGRCHELEHRLRKSRVNAHPKYIVHHKVSVAHRSGYAILAVLVSRLTEQIAAEEKARTDFVGLQRANKVLSAKWRLLAHTDGKAKPRWIGMRRRFRQNQILLEPGQRGLE